MSEPDNLALLAKLREPFPSESVGKLPKITCGACRDTRDKSCPKHAKIECEVCGNFMSPAHLHLDYVGHAVVTARLLDIDPLWSWEPLAFGPDGLPAHDKDGGLWIRLTICDVTRLGYGDGPDDKQRIGDAIRNAGMRFGIALYLWGKDELEALIGNEMVAKSRKRKPPSSSTPTTGRRPIQGRDPATSDGEPAMSARDRNKLITYFAHLTPPITDPKAITAEVNKHLVAPVEALVKLSAAQGASLFAILGIDSPAVPPRVGGEQTEETV